MTEDRKPSPGMAEVSVEFEHEVIDQDAILEKLADEMYAAYRAYDTAWQVLDEAEGDARKADPEAVYPSSFSFSVPGISHLFEETGTLTPSPEQIRKFTHGNPGNSKAQAEALIKHLEQYGERCIAAFEAQGWAEKQAEVTRTKAQEDAAFDQVLEIPAQGLRGIRAKAKALLLPHEWEEAKRGDATNLDGQVNANALVPLVADLERLASTPAPEDPVLALKREWEARYKALDEHRDDPDADDSDEAVQPFYDRLHETEVEILRTQATTLAGIAVKLILWARLHCNADEVSGLSWTRKSIEGDPHDLDHLPVLSALLDLERISSGAIAPEPPAGVGFMAKSVPLIRAKSSDLERAVSNLEGASNALNNFAQTDDLPTEVDIGLQWLAYQIDAGMVDLRDEYDKLHGDAGGPETKGARP